METSSLITQNKLIFLIDDHPIVSYGVESILIEQPYRIHSFQNIHAVFQQLKQSSPDLIISDLKMPNLKHGLSFIQNTLTNYPHIPILIFSGIADEKTILHTIQLGVKGYLIKENVSENILLSAIELTLSGSTYFSENIKEMIINDYQACSKRNQLITAPFDHRTLYGLSKNKKTILKLICQGKTTREIAELMTLSVSTINGHKYDVMKKINVTSQAELLNFMFTSGWNMYL